MKNGAAVAAIACAYRGGGVAMNADGFSEGLVNANHAGAHEGGNDDVHD